MAQKNRELSAGAGPLLEELRRARQRIADLEASMGDADALARSTEALKLRVERLDLAMSVTNDGLWDWDVETGEVFFDSRYYTMAGYEPDEFPGTFEEWAKRVDPSDFPGVDRAVKAYLEGSAEDYDEEFRFRRRDGDWMWIRARVKIVERDDDGAATRVIGTHSDIDAFKRAEEERNALEVQLSQAHRLEAVGRLAGGVAHDFNNMLCAIAGNAELALGTLGEDRTVEPLIHEILNSAERASRLTRQLLAFSRNQVIELRAADLGQLIEDFQPMLVRLIGEDVRLRTRLAEDRGMVRADPGQVEQVLVNLILNARDAMPRGGEIRVAVENATVGEEASQRHARAQVGEFVVLSVTDDGVGMDAETRESVFEPFFTTKGQGQGAGLGLSSVFGIVEQHGGWVDVISEKGLGARFELYFPRIADADGVAVDAEEEQAEPTEGGDETILVVEDEQAVREVAVGILDRLGYTVLGASSGPEALRMVQERSIPIDLLVTDVIMPRMNGRDLVRALSALRPGLRVLFVSGYGRDLVAHHGVLDDGLQLLNKPYTVHSLARRVRQVLDHD